MGKRLGQHFLIDPEAARKITELLSIDSEDNILEIGPGGGFLTSYLVESSASVTAIELDARLAERLINDSHENLTVINADFLQTDLESLSFNKICGNIPYQICGRIIERVMRTGVQWKKCVLMLPDGVAQRAAAGPGMPEYSFLSVMCGATGDAKIEFMVNREDFDPAPKINSFVISITRKTGPLSGNFYKLVKAAFSSKRKKLRNSLSIYFARPASDMARLITAGGIRPDIRPQNIDIPGFKKLLKVFENEGIL
ncbi:MAG: 16S rRNA (adenine(1518)-N(6)/adenine(1519)-N(6))-dimethyltransferase RsmA [Elusimicrobiota bacterium]